MLNVIALNLNLIQHILNYTTPISVQREQFLVTLLFIHFVNMYLKY